MSDDVETPIHRTRAGVDPARRRRRDPGVLAAAGPAIAPAVGAVLDEPELALPPDTSGPRVPPEPPRNGGGGGFGGAGGDGRPPRPRLRQLRLLAMILG